MRQKFGFHEPMLLAGLIFLLFLFSLLIYSPVQAMNFKDLEAEDECLPYVNYLVQKDVIKGFPDGTFQPGGVVTRAQMAQMLIQAKAVTTQRASSIQFTDVKSDHWAYNAISAAAQSGLISGYPDGTFKPEASATRAEVAVMLLRLTTAPMPELAPPSGVSDLSSHWASLPGAVALDAGIMSLAEANRFAPDKPASRAEVVQGLATMLTLNPEQNRVDLTGTLVPVKGKVQIARADGTTVNVTAASLCGKGDTVISGSNSTAQLKFPDGSGFKINQNSRLVIKEALGCATILPDGTQGAIIDTLEVELPEGQIFGALASTYQNSDPDNSTNQNQPTAWSPISDHPLLMASLQLPTVLAVNKKAASPWYKESSRKKVRVKVDMPWGVAAVRGTFWMNEVRNGHAIINAATGDVEVTAGGQTVAIGAGQTTMITGSSAPPTPPAPMPLPQQQQWNMEQQWVQQTAGNMQSGLPLTPQPPSLPPNGIGNQILNDIRDAVPIFGTTPNNSGSSSSHSQTPIVATPSANPAAGTYDAPQSVSLTCATDGATIYYTTDGSDPTSSNTRTVYSTFLDISTATTIKAYAVSTGMTDSATATFDYTIIANMSATAKPRLAYNPALDQYLMVYEKQEENRTLVCGQRMQSDSSPVGSEFTISSTTGYNREPVVAYDPVNQNYLVLWSDNYIAICGQTVNSGGELVGDRFEIYTNNDLSQSTPELIYGNAKFLAVWRTANTGDYQEDLIGCFLSIAQDTPTIGNTITIADMLWSQYEPALAYNSTNDKYIVVFTDSNDILYRLVNADGSTGNITDIAVDGYQLQPSVAYDETNNRFLVVWYDRNNWNNDIKGMFVEPAGASFMITSTQEYEGHPSIARGNNQFMVVWEKTISENTEIYGQTINLDGSAASDEFALISAAGDQCNPIIAYSNTNNDRYAIVYEDEASTPPSIKIVSRTPVSSDPDPGPDPASITIHNNASGEDSVSISVFGNGDVIKVYDAATGGTLLGQETAGEGATVNITDGFDAALNNIYVSITPVEGTESSRTVKAIPKPAIMQEYTDYTIDNGGYGKLAFTVTADQKIAMETAAATTINTLVAYVTTDLETTFADLAAAEATIGVVIPADNVGAAIARDEGCYGYAIVAYDASEQVVAQFISNYWEVVESGLSRTPTTVSVNTSFDRTFTLTAYTSAGTFKSVDLSSYVTLEGCFAGLNKIVTRLSDTHITVNISGNLSQTGAGKICIAGDAFANAAEPGGGVRQVVSITVN